MMKLYDPYTLAAERNRELITRAAEDRHRSRMLDRMGPGTSLVDHVGRLLIWLGATAQSLGCRLTIAPCNQPSLDTTSS